MPNNNTSDNSPQSELLRLKKICEINNTIDDLIEEAQIKQMSLEETIKLTAPEIMKLLNCEGLFIKTYSEDLSMKIFNALKKGYKSIPSDIKAIEERVKNKEVYINSDSGTIIALRIDVADEYFGIFGIFFDRKLSEEETLNLTEEINTILEVMDNYFSMIYNASRKQKTIEALGECVSDKVMSRGMDKAMERLYESINYNKLIFIYCNESETHNKSNNKEHINYIIYEHKKRIADNSNPADTETNQIITNEGRRLFDKQATVSKELVDKLDLKKYVEMALIYGKNKDNLVGKIIIDRQENTFNTTQRDILNSFSTLLRQRIVDYNKEYRHLSEYFSPKTVNKLLSEENYDLKYLKPKEQNVAILYSDITSFTKISEGILKKPGAIGEFVDEWSYRAVEIIWENDGVFDKMVGDCIIALFGPPYYEYDAKNICIKAIKTAIELNQWTNELSKQPKYQFLRESELIPGLGVATGINYTPCFVGKFGPNRNFTGFSSGMNNTARLQHLGGFRDIFVMDKVKEVIGKGVSGFKFGEMRQEKVKNVKEPIKFYPIIYDTNF